MILEHYAKIVFQLKNYVFWFSFQNIFKIFITVRFVKKME